MSASEESFTMDDVEDLRYMKGSRFDILAAVASRAAEKIKPTSAATDDGDPSSATPESNSDGQQQVRQEAELQLQPTSSTSTGKKKRKSRRKKKKKIFEKQPTLPRPPLPEGFKIAIEGMARGRNVTELRLLLQKFLYPSDVAPNNSRFSIPVIQIADEFLREEEKRNLEKKKWFMRVKMIEPSLAVETVKFNQWGMAKGEGRKTSYVYVINGEWNDIVRRNGLEEEMEVQLWSFRVDQDLCFALVRQP